MLQGLSQLAKQVRESQTTGVITSVSGMLTKQGLISLSAEQPPQDCISVMFPIKPIQN